MMLCYDARGAFQEFYSAQDLLSVQRMFAHANPFFIGQLGRLAQDRIGNANLADVVKQRTKLERFHFRSAQSVFATKPQTESHDPLRMPVSLRVASFKRSRQCLQRRSVSILK